MTEENNLDKFEPVAKAEKAKTVSAFLIGKKPATAFLTSLQKGDAKLPDEQERAAIVEMIATNSSFLVRLTDLLKLAMAGDVGGRFRQTLGKLGGEIVRSQNGNLGGWGLLGTSSSEAELSTLVRNLKIARDAGHKEQISKAELLLQLGIAILTSRVDFDVIGATKVLSSQLFDKNLEPHAAEKLAKKAFRKASIKNLEVYAAIGTFVSGRLQDCRRQLSTQMHINLNSQEALKISQARVAAQATELAEAKSALAELNSELHEIRNRVAGVKGGAADDMIKLKARIRQFYQAKVERVLQTADEALSLNPPAVRVGLERVQDVLNDVRKEITWLNQL